jgi:hypothetical protein
MNSPIATTTAVDIDQRWQHFAPDLPAEKVLFSDVIPGGCHWSWALPRGVALRLTALGAGANLSLVRQGKAGTLQHARLPEGPAHSALHPRSCADERYGPGHGVHYP